jgi:nucleoside-diphosphate-sugar epimerase
MRWLVTGANGFLGSAIIARALQIGIELRATDRGRHSVPEGPEYFPADILELERHSEIFTGVDVAIHAAGLAHVFHAGPLASTAFKQINETGTACAARAAARAGVGHFVLVSSVSVYGGSRAGGGEDSGCQPGDAYSESKLNAERRAAEIAEATGMRLTVLRLATLYGEGDPGNVGRLMRAIDRGRFLWIGDGSNRKSLLHRDDAARACLLAARKPPVARAVYNVSAPACRMREVVEGLAAALGRRIPPVQVPALLARDLSAAAAAFAPKRLGGIHAYVTKWLAEDVYDSGRFDRTFEYQTKVSLAEGLAREVCWYRRRYGSEGA